MNLKEKICFAIKFLLISIVLFTIVRTLIIRKYDMTFIAILTLFVFSLPYIVSKIFKIKFPSTLEIVIFLFAFLAQIMGDVYDLYIIIPWWDDFLHFICGMMFIEIGLFFISIIIRNNPKININLHLKFVISFCFTITILVFWECFEYGIDRILKTDTQKDTVITEITSSKFANNDNNNKKNMTINSIVINDVDWNKEYGGYLDIGLFDTMNDLIDGIAGAFIYSFFKYIFMKKEIKGKVS